MRPAPTCAAGKAIVYARRGVVVPAEFPAFAVGTNVEANTPVLADIPAPGSRVGYQQPLLTVLAEGPDLAAVEQLLRSRVQAIQERLGC